jgi:uncharacterized membrane protein
LFNFLRESFLDFAIILFVKNNNFSTFRNQNKKDDPEVELNILKEKWEFGAITEEKY